MDEEPTRFKRLHVDEPAAGSIATAMAVSDGEIPSEVETVDPKTSASKKAIRTRQRKAGKLRYMLDMPLDVVLEICAHLHPKDLLHLARASKDLRKLFMSRNLMSVWKAAMENLPELPPCPEDLSLPAYINLMFSLHCHSCLKKNCQDFDWPSRIRLCNACHLQMEKSYGVTDDIARMIRPRVLSDVVLPIREHRVKSAKGRRYYSHVIQEFTTNFRETPISEREEFLQKRAEFIKSRWKGTNETENYLCTSRSSRADELEAQRIVRREQIIERLQEAGYEAEVEFLLSKPWHVRYRTFVMIPEVRKTQALTDKTWYRIKENVFKYMDGVKEERLEASRKDLLCKRLQVLDGYITKFSAKRNDCPLYTCEIVYKVPEVHEILDPYLEYFDVERLVRLLNEKVPIYLADREKRWRQALGDLIKQELGLEELADPFALAITTWLRCSSCQLVFTPSEAFLHSCMFVRTLAPCKGMTREFFCAFSFWARSTGNFKRERLWYHKVDRYQEGIKLASEIVAKCGRDPKVASSSDLDADNIKLLCLDPGMHVSRVKDWSSAMHQHCYDYGGFEYRRATETEIALVRPLEAALQREQAETPLTFRCGLCSGLRVASIAAAVTHLQEVHGFPELDEESEGDYKELWPDPPLSDLPFLFLPRKNDVVGEPSYVTDALVRGAGIYYDYEANDEKLASPSCLGHSGSASSQVP